MRAPLLLLPLLVACGESTMDADYDGIPAGEDCDDLDPTVHPGAHDDPGDGIDADCDGTDPQHAYVGDWTFDTISAVFGSFELVDEDTEQGGVSLGADGVAEMDASIGLDPDLLGYELDVPIAMSGTISPIATGADMARLRVEGELLGEDSYVDLDCQVLGEDEMLCWGALKALEINLSMDAVLVR